jgi:hypothetical protein
MHRNPPPFSAAVVHRDVGATAVLRHISAVMLVFVAVGLAGPILPASAFAQERSNPPAKSASPTPSTMELEAELSDLKAQLAEEEEIRKEQQDDAQYFFQAVTVIIGAAALVVAIAAIGATIAGYTLVRRYVEAEFSKRAAEAYDEHGKPLLERRADEMQAQVNAKLADVDTELAAALELFRRAQGPS